MPCVKNANRTSIMPITRGYRTPRTNSFTRQTWQTLVTNSSTNHKSWWMRCSPRAPKQPARYVYLIVNWEMTRRNDLYGKHDEWKFSGLNIVWVGKILDWIFLIGVIRVGILWVGIVRVGVILTGNFPMWKFSGWELSDGNHPRGKFLVYQIQRGPFKSNRETSILRSHGYWQLSYGKVKRIHGPKKCLKWFTWL